MALSTYLHLTLGGNPVVGSVTQKGREGTIEVNAFEWSFDSDGNVGEVKFTSDLEKGSVPIAQGLKSSAVADALFDFWQPTSSGVEVKFFTLHGTNGKVTSASVWMLNNQDPALMKYATTMQYTMSFAAIEQVWTADGTSVTIP
jgi:type VI protein secretion system component Hcp